MNNYLRFFLTGIMICGLIGVRALENKIFYDPLLEFFKGDYKTMPLPEIRQGKLFLHLFFRYSLNTFFSLIIIRLVFQNREYTRLSFFLYSILFVLFFLLFVFLLGSVKESEGFLFLFYVRRFLIQPVFLLLLLPAFYFYTKNLTDF